jgi:midasin (ATPase involved in ribosome maturation)
VLAVKPAPAIDHLEYVDLIFLQRMRTADDREHVKRLFNSIFGEHPFPPSEVPPFYHVTPNYLQVRRKRTWGDRRGERIGEDRRGEGDREILLQGDMKQKI